MLQTTSHVILTISRVTSPGKKRTKVSDKNINKGRPASTDPRFQYWQRTLSAFYGR